MDLQNFTLFAAAGSLVAFWQQIKGFLVRVFSLVVRCDIIPHSNVAEAFLQEILPDTRLIRWGNNTYLSENQFFPRHKLWANLLFCYFKSYPALYKKRPIILAESGEYGLTVTYIVGTFPMKEILEKINKKEFNKNIEIYSAKVNNFYVCDISGSDEVTNKSQSSQPTSSGVAVENTSSNNRGIFSRTYSLKQKAVYFGVDYSSVEADKQEEKKEKDYFWSKEALQLDGEINFWLSNRTWYRERGLSWRRGALLFGPAGSGKSKLVVKCAEKNGLPVFRLNISNMSNSEFLKAFERESGDGHIILMEDIDGIFFKRTNLLAAGTHTKQLLSFDVFINAIGGVKSASGAFVVLTTNHPEKLDEALTRSGRLDAKIEVGPLCEEGRRFIAENILRDWPLEIDKSVRECDNMVAADFENHCIELAIREKNKER